MKNFLNLTKRIKVKRLVIIAIFSFGAMFLVSHQEVAKKTDKFKSDVFISNIYNKEIPKKTPWGQEIKRDGNVLTISIDNGSQTELLNSLKKMGIDIKVTFGYNAIRVDLNKIEENFKNNQLVYIPKNLEEPNLNIFNIEFIILFLFVTVVFYFLYSSLIGDDEVLGISYFRQ